MSAYGCNTVLIYVLFICAISMCFLYVYIEHVLYNLCLSTYLSVHLLIHSSTCTDLPA